MYYRGMERYTKKEQIQGLCYTFHTLLERDDRLVKMAEIAHQIALIRNDKGIIGQLEFELYGEESDDLSSKETEELIKRRTAKAYLVPPLYVTEADYHELSKEIPLQNIPFDEEIIWENSLLEVAKSTFIISRYRDRKFIVLKDDLFRYKIKLELMLKKYISSVVIELEKEEGVELGDISGKERV